MKKFALFAVIVFCLFFAAQALLFFDKTQAFSIWVQSHQIYLGGFVSLTAASLAIFCYIKYKKAKAKVSPEVWAAANIKMKEQLFKNGKFFSWQTLSLVIFIIVTQIISRSNMSLNLNFLIISGLTLIYMVGVVAASYQRQQIQKRRLAQAEQEKENAGLKLKSIRSQLNPHFMFNALTSIQNLMNKNDVAAANHYLSLFASLTRKVLDTGDKDLITIADEEQIQGEYLQMEQLRFGFKYNIAISAAINKDNTEIPAMLLQPFVENAVKHGMAGQQNGFINLTIDKDGNNLILAVADNGKGFDKIAIQNKTTSFGLKLSEQRIELLNQLYPTQPVTLNIDSTATGTRVTVTLVDLLA